MSTPPPPPPPGDQPPSWQTTPQQQPFPQPPSYQQPPQPGYAQPGYPQQQPYPPGAHQQQWQSAPAMERAKAPIGWVATIAAAACAVSPVLPWVNGEAASENGFFEYFGGNRFNGVAIAVLAGIAAVLLGIGTAIRNRVLLIIGAVVAGLAAFLPLGDLNKINDLNDVFGLSGSDEFTPGVGLFVALGTGIVALVCAIIAAVKTKKRPVGHAG